MKYDYRESSPRGDPTTVPLFSRRAQTNSKRPDSTYDSLSLYIHGGRDLKEGSIATMWRVNINGMKALFRDPFYPVEWEPIALQGRNPGKISHHKAFVISQQNVLVYGGLKGEDSNPDIFLYNAIANTWSNVQFAVSALTVTLTPAEHDR